MTALVAVDDAHFAWMLNGTPATYSGLRLPPGGVDEVPILAHVRGIVHELHVGGCRAAWMIVADDEVVGLISYKTSPDAAGEAEIGYGIASERRQRGHATRAVAAVIAYATADVATRVLTAETLVENMPSQRTLERNGFERGELRFDDHGDNVIVWRRRL